MFWTDLTFFFFVPSVPHASWSPLPVSVAHIQISLHLSSWLPSCCRSDTSILVRQCKNVSTCGAKSQQYKSWVTQEGKTYVTPSNVRCLLLFTYTKTCTSVAPNRKDSGNVLFRKDPKHSQSRVPKLVLACVTCCWAKTNSKSKTKQAQT